MNIGMVLGKKFPPDIRVEKEARSLIKDGHRVFLLSYGNEEGNKYKTMIKDLIVHNIQEPEKEMFLLNHKWNTFRYQLSFYNKYWAEELYRFVSDFKIQVLHVHDLPLLETGIITGKKLMIPVVADLHENYPSVLKIQYKYLKSLKTRFFKNPERWLFYERRALKSVKHIIVVVDEARERIIQQHGISPDKITTLMNTEDVDYFLNIKYNEEVISEYNEKFIVAYIGGGGPHRGLDTVIRSILYLKDMIKEIYFLLVGLDYPEKIELLNLAKKIGVEKNIEIITWKPFVMIPSFINVSDICLVPHLKNQHTDTTIPHKLFQYMLMGKPVITSDCKPLKRIVNETGSGLVFKSGDPKDLAESIERFYRDEKFREKCAYNGYRAVIKRYNWERESENLLSLYRSINK